jgi:hypothetical protein
VVAGRVAAVVVVMSALVYRDHAHTAKVVRARKGHWCDIKDMYPMQCVGRIEPGQQYIRSVIFPGHDAGPSRYDRGARPWSHEVCLNCAVNYRGLDDLAKAATS